MFEKELAYFIDKQDELVKKHNGKVLAIQDQKIIGVFDNPLKAYLAIKGKGQLGKVMLQPCAPGPSAYTATLSTIGLVE